MQQLPRLPILMSLCASLALGACHSHLGKVPKLATDERDYPIEAEIRDIVYTPAAWPQALKADLYLPRNPGLRPVVITVHGGGWANRSRADMDDLGAKLARRGYAVFNVSYRFAPRYPHPAQLEDLQQALAWIKDNAENHRLDTSRINTWGYSSGAHLAALIASVDTNDVSQAADLPPIRAVVAGGIPADLRKYSGSPIVMRFMGGDRDEMPERYAEASPAWHISADDPPVFLYHGKLDRLVARDQATDYYDALIAAGIPAELYLHNWHGHGSLFLFGGDAENRAIDFLERNNAQNHSAMRP